MGQGEQQTLYPFLGQGSSIPQATAPTPSNVQAIPQPNNVPETIQKPAEPARRGRPPKKRRNTKSTPGSLNGSEDSKDGGYGAEVIPEPTGIQAQMTSLDEDINPSRKRRRVSAGDLDWKQQSLAKNEVGISLNMSASSSPQQQSQEPSNGGSHSAPPEKYRSKDRLCKLLPKPTQDLSGIEPFSTPHPVPEEGTLLDTYQPPSGEHINGIPQPILLTPDSIKPVHSDAELLKPENSEPTLQKKTLKLNPNGKLLSSPGSKKTRSQSPRRSGRRKTANKKVPLIIKYPVDGVGRAHFGKLIDDICNGRTRHPPPKAPPPPAEPPKVLKPTHPFFLGKAANSSPESPQPTQSTIGPEEKPSPNSTQLTKKSTPAVNIIQPKKIGTKPPSSSFGAGFSVKPKVSKGSGLIEPLWPPRDFSHISVSQGTLGQSRGSDAKLLGTREKKGKTPISMIPDSESILHPLSQIARDAAQEISTQAFPVKNDTLRRPERYVADGKTLQRLVADELSFNYGRQTSQENGHENRALLPERGCHPAVSRLALSIPSSWTAFDKGEFDILPWTHKYAPATAEDVLQPGPEVLVLRDWLRHLMVSTVDTGSNSKEGIKPKQGKAGRKTKRNKRRKTDELDGFIVSSENEASNAEELTDPEDDELSGGVTFMSKRSYQPNNMTPDVSKARGKMWNAVLISGPSGCGKTASVFAAAKELDFEVFELNPGSRRSAKDILERVGDMTRNHLVHKLDDSEQVANSPGSNPEATPAEPDSGKQTSMNSFFVQKPTEKKPISKGAKSKKTEPEEPKRHRTQKQSLILLEEVDVLFEEDKQFWSGVISLIDQSKRPIIMTCRDEGLLPLHDLSFHRILRYSPPPPSLSVDYMLLLAASEGHLLQRKAVSDLYTALNQDLRASITELNFWCQMALGSEKSGIDWMIGNFRRPMNLDDRPRVISKNTYLSGMGWYGRDMACYPGNQAARDITMLSQCVEQWPLEVMDWQGPKPVSRTDVERDDSDIEAQRRGNRLAALQCDSEFTDMQSMLDLLCRAESKEVTNDTLDTSSPPMSDKQRLGYIEGYHLLEADHQVDFSRLSADISSTLTVLMRDSFLGDSTNGEASVMEGILKYRTNERPEKMALSQLHLAFEPVMENIDTFYSPGRQAPSFENGIPAISEDLAPYIRSIIAFDLRLERRRMELSGLLSQGHGKRMRTTRASRAALEGGSKQSTRRERWFPRRLNTARVLGTGGKGWQDLLHFYHERAEAAMDAMDEAKEGTSDGSSDTPDEAGV
ncbi:hypothetical protein FQN54_006990 [Arachnomyces sp. PD_36]|nr:hypothetical protein FQN54_006990 [Arachnomyces sp. PD_36]